MDFRNHIDDCVQLKELILTDASHWPPHGRVADPRREDGTQVVRKKRKATIFSLLPLTI